MRRTASRFRSDGPAGRNRAVAAARATARRPAPPRLEAQPSPRPWSAASRDLRRETRGTAARQQPRTRLYNPAYKRAPTLGDVAPYFGV